MATTTDKKTTTPKAAPKAKAPAKAAAPAKTAAAAPTTTPSTETLAERGMRRMMTGVVTSDKMQKTRVVTVTRRVRHGAYKKYVMQRVKYKAHDEKNETRAGDRVEIVESRPLSRDKRWRIQRLVERPEQA